VVALLPLLPSLLISHRDGRRDNLCIVLHISHLIGRRGMYVGGLNDLYIEGQSTS
jgi:hypothetical protein